MGDIRRRSVGTEGLFEAVTYQQIDFTTEANH